MGNAFIDILMSYIRIMPEKGADKQKNGRQKRPLASENHPNISRLDSMSFSKNSLSSLVKE